MSSIFRIYTSGDGETHFEDIEMGTFPVNQLRFTTSAPGAFGDWHNEKQRQFVVVQSGRASITVSDGEVRVMEPGAVMLAEDLTGKGHQMRVLGDGPCVWMFVGLDQ